MLAGGCANLDGSGGAGCRIRSVKEILDGMPRRHTPITTDDIADARRRADALVDKLTDAHGRHMTVPEDRLKLVGHCTAYRPDGMDDQARRAEVAELWWLLGHLGAEVDRLRLELLRTARREDGMTFGDLAPILGIERSGRQGAEALFKRLEAAVAGGPKDEQVARDSGRAERETAAADRAMAGSKGTQLVVIAEGLLRLIPEELWDELGLDREHVREKVESSDATGPADGLLNMVRWIVTQTDAAGELVGTELSAVLEHGAQVLGVTAGQGPVTG